MFEKNGISEIIDHKINGYVAKYQNIEDFKSGINWCLDNLNTNKMNERLEVLKINFQWKK